MINDEMKVAAVKAYAEVDGKCRPAAMQKALEAALSTLPIAVEGKVDPDEEMYQIGVRDGYSQAVQQIDRLTGGDGEYRYCTDHDPDRHTPGPAEMIQRIVDRFEVLNLLDDATKTGRDQEWGISSPGKDGGQEAARIGDSVLAWMVKYDLLDAGNEYRAEDVVAVLNDFTPHEDGKDGGQEVEADEPVAWRYSFDEGVTWNHGGKKPGKHRFGGPDIVQPLYTRPQPASTALVERLAEELTAAASLLETLSEELPDDDVSGVMMRVMAERNRSALSASQSTSRKGEIR